MLFIAKCKIFTFMAHMQLVARWRTGQRVFPLYHTATFLSIGNLYKFKRAQVPKFVHFLVDIPGRVWYTKTIKEGRTLKCSKWKSSHSPALHWKTSALFMGLTQRSWKIEKSSKTLLTKPGLCAILRPSRERRIPYEDLQT